MLTLGIRYLMGFSAAAEFSDPTSPEWPPHPGRVFMAMASAHFQTGEEPAERRALEWLESLPCPPRIHAPEVFRRLLVTHYVPVNDEHKSHKDKTIPLSFHAIPRPRQPRTFARCWLERENVFLIWPDQEPPPEIHQSLTQICSKVTRIGHSSSLVHMWCATPAELRPPNWLPDEERATVRLRLPTEGTLLELERRHATERRERYGQLRCALAYASTAKEKRSAKKCMEEEFSDGEPLLLRPFLAMDCGYARAETAAAISVRGTVFSPHLLTYTLEASQNPSGYKYLDLPCAPQVIQRWREALCAASNDLGAEVRLILSGHALDGKPLDRPHLAFLPLAFVGHEHADGRLVGMGLVLPVGLPRDVRRGVLVAVGRVRELRLGRLGVWQVGPVLEDRQLLNLQTDVWTGDAAGARRWASVTPVAFDRHPKSRDRSIRLTEAEAMLREASKRIGLPVPLEVIVTLVSAHPGSPLSCDFPPLTRKDGGQRQHAHAILVFNEPVRGPVLLGAGRYKGYGVFRPLEG